MNWVTLAKVWDDSGCLSAGADKKIKYWDLEDPKGHKEMRGHDAAVTQLKRLGNSATQVVSGSLDGTVRIWDVYSGRELVKYEHEGPIKALAMNKQFLGSYTEEEGLQLRDFVKGEVVFKI